MLFTFAPIKFDIDVNVSFGDLRRVWVDVSKNFITVNFRSDGFMRVEGVLPNLADIDHLFRPDGKMFFHSPAEHTFYGKSRYDFELEIFFHDIDGK